MKNRLTLPAGIHTFERIRTEGHVYVDKTKYLVDIIDNVNVCFLARPRRFGKSLTVSTFEALFSGRRELFEGLYAEEFLNRVGFVPSPVIKLDMSMIVTNAGMEGIRETIAAQLKTIAIQLNVTLSDSKLPGLLFNSLIINTYTKYKQKVVVLVDEYDAPYTEFVNDTDMANEVRGELRNFYKQMKACDDKIRFIFLTGISKFARFGVFSTLNTTTDISLMPEFAGICGYTEDEIVKYFPDYLEETAKKNNISTEELLDNMRHYYNGFCFDDEVNTKLYNPFSILSFFTRKKFYDFWIDTGSSIVMANYLKRKKLTVEQFRNYPIPVSFAESPGDVDTTSPEGFLYQTGYLTLRDKTKDKFLLDYPNTEVLNAMSRLMIQNIVTETVYNAMHNELTTAVSSNNVEEFVKVANRLLAKIPYDDFSGGEELTEKNKLIFLEKICRSTILSFLHGCGLNVIGEMHTNKGRSDLVFSHVENPTVWVVEIKIASKRQSAKKRAQEALQQIKENNYAAPFESAICLGVAIKDERRLITEWAAFPEK